MKKRMLLMLLGAGLFFGAIFGFKWFGNTMMNRYFDDMPMPASTISATEARTETWSEEIQAVGSALAVNGTQVTTEIGGIVDSLRFESGQAVKKGDILLTLESSTEAATLQALEATARLAVTQRDRFRSLYEQKLVSRAELDQRESEAAAARANANAQRAKLAQKTIRAPFDGLLGIRQVNLGEYLNPGQAIVGLQALDPILVNFTLPEQRLPQARVGAQIVAETDALPGQRFTGTITAIEPEVDAGTRNFRLQATLPNPDRTLRPGSFMRVRFAVGEAEPVVVIPQTAISFNPYGNSVYVVNGNGDGSAEAPLTVTQRFVRTGVTRGDLVVVLEGLEPGERVATSGLLKLRNGGTVVINNAVEPSAEDRPAPGNA